MQNFSKTLLPPILEYTYPAFQYEGDNGENVTVSFSASLSIVNTLDQVDHIQVRIVSLNTNKNALNPKLFPRGYYFIPMSNVNNFVITLNTIINEENIFKTGEEAVYPSYYKMQIRIGEKTLNNLDPSWGQDVPESWLNENAQYFSEWSNSAILKTVQKPQFGIFNLDLSSENIVIDPNYIWQGYYKTEDDNESLKNYKFSLLDEKGQVIEESPDIYIGEYEKPFLFYKFRTVFENNKSYFLSLYIKSVTDYEATVKYKIKAEFDYVKIYDIFKVRENNDDAHNLIDIKARQIHLVPTFFPTEKEWLRDSAMNQYGETGITHYINLNQLNANADFSVPYDTFSILLSITDFKGKVQTRLANCFLNDNYILYLGQNSIFGSEFYLGVYLENSKTCFVLKEVFKNNGKDTNNYYIIKNDKTVEDNEEYLFIIKKYKGDTIFESLQWHNNIFIKKGEGN